MKRNIMLVIFSSLILPFTMAATTDTLSLTLDKALQIALSESPSIKVANREIERVDYSKKERLAALFPNIAASAAYQRTLKKQKIFFDIPGMPSNPNGFEMGEDNTFTGGFSATLPIVSPTLWTTINMSKLDAELALESARSSKQSLINQVTKAFYGVLLAHDSYNVFKRSYDNTRENARIIQDKYKQGTVSEFEWIRADVQVRNAQSNVVSAESAVNMSKLQLKLLMGINMDIEVKIDGSLSDFEGKMLSDILNIDTTTLSTNSDLRQFDIKSRQLDQTLKLQKSQWWPTLAASFNYQYMSMGNDPVSFSYKWFPYSTATLSLSIPVFEGGARLFKQKQIKIQQQELKDQRENLKHSLELQAMNCLDNIKKAMEKIASNKEGLRQAEKAVEISKKMYEVGSGTYLDLSNSELAYITAGLSYNQSIYDYLSAKSDLEKLLGKE